MAGSSSEGGRQGPWGGCALVVYTHLHGSEKFKLTSNPLITLDYI